MRYLLSITKPVVFRDGEKVIFRRGEEVSLNKGFCEEALGTIHKFFDEVLIAVTNEEDTRHLRFDTDTSTKSPVK